MWDPATYLRYGDERSRPFGDLLARVDPGRAGDVVDLGCGPGNLTVGLAERWPGVRVLGLDSSAEMIEVARALGSPVEFAVADVNDWHAGPDIAVVIANAVLQWVPGHVELLRRWVGELSPGAVIAFQVPGNFGAPSHRAARSVAAEPRWRDRVPPVLRDEGAVLDPVDYAELLRAAGCAVDAWETTYVHQLPATATTHPVLAWTEGTALRPVRAILSDDDWAAYRSDLQTVLADEYPVRDGVVFFPFRRIFVVAAVRGR